MKETNSMKPCHIYVCKFKHQFSKIKLRWSIAGKTLNQPSITFISALQSPQQVRILLLQSFMLYLLLRFIGFPACSLSCPHLHLPQLLQTISILPSQAIHHFPQLLDLFCKRDGAGDFVEATSLLNHTHLQFILVFHHAGYFGRLRRSCLALAAALWLQETDSCHFGRLIIISFCHSDWL